MWEEHAGKNADGTVTMNHKVVGLNIRPIA